jgi:hypothetical protein
MFQNKFHLLKNTFLLFLNMSLLQLLLIHLLVVHVNPGHLHLMHHHLIPLNQQSEVMLHISRKLDHPTLSPFLVAQAQSQMLIQGEYPAEEEADEHELANVGLASTYSESEVISHIRVEG